MKKFLLLVALFLINQLHPYENKIDLLSLYKDLHANPELSYQEFETSEKLANLLESIGYEVTRNVGGNGVVALLKNGNGKSAHRGLLYCRVMDFRVPQKSKIQKPIISAKIDCKCVTILFHNKKI